MEDPAADLVVAFNNAINTQDLDGLCALMASDHRFVDSAGGTVVGKDTCRSAWAAFFESFPDYRNVFDKHHGHRTRTGRRRRTIGVHVRTIRGPARWHATVVAGSILEWRVEDGSMPP